MFVGIVVVDADGGIKLLLLLVDDVEVEGGMNEFCAFGLEGIKDDFAFTTPAELL